MNLEPDLNDPDLPFRSSYTDAVRERLLSPDFMLSSSQVAAILADPSLRVLPAEVVEAYEVQGRLLQEVRAAIVSLTQFTARAQHMTLLLDQLDHAIEAVRLTQKAQP